MIKTILATAVFALLLAGCAKNEDSFVGRWQACGIVLESGEIVRFAALSAVRSIRQANPDALSLAGKYPIFLIVEKGGTARGHIGDKEGQWQIQDDGKKLVLVGSENTVFPMGFKEGHLLINLSDKWIATCSH